MADVKRKADAGDERAADLYAKMVRTWGGFGLKNLPNRVYSKRHLRYMRARLPSWLLRLCDYDVDAAMSIRADAQLLQVPASPRKPGRPKVENPSPATLRKRKQRERDKRQSDE